MDLREAIDFLKKEIPDVGFDYQAPFKIDWLKLENQQRKVLKSGISDKAKLFALDAIIGYHTKRGCEIWPRV